LIILHTIKIICFTFTSIPMVLHLHGGGLDFE
jgi:hypothetical protein